MKCSSDGIRCVKKKSRRMSWRHEVLIESFYISKPRPLQSNDPFDTPTQAQHVAARTSPMNILILNMSSEFSAMDEFIKKGHKNSFYDRIISHFLHVRRGSWRLAREAFDIILQLGNNFHNDGCWSEIFSVWRCVICGKSRTFCAANRCYSDSIMQLMAPATLLAGSGGKILFKRSHLWAALWKIYIFNLSSSAQSISWLLGPS